MSAVAPIASMLLHPRNNVLGLPGEDAKARDRMLTDEELRAVWQACGDDDFGRTVRLLILRWRPLKAGRRRWCH